MQQRIELRTRREIVLLQPQRDVGNEASRRSRVNAQRAEGIGQHEQKAHPQREEQDENERREDAPDPSPIEFRDAEPTGSDILADQAGDKKAGDDEKHIDANEAAAKYRVEIVETDDEQDGNGAQAVNVSSIRQ